MQSVQWHQLPRYLLKEEIYSETSVGTVSSLLNSGAQIPVEARPTRDEHATIHLSYLRWSFLSGEVIKSLPNLPYGFSSLAIAYCFH